MKELYFNYRGVSSRTYGDSEENCVAPLTRQVSAIRRGKIVQLCNFLFRVHKGVSYNKKRPKWSFPC